VPRASVIFCDARHAALLEFITDSGMSIGASKAPAT